jgi:hypothetical protein
LNIPSSAGAGVGSFDFSVSFAFGFAFANDLKRSDFSRLRFDLESDFFNVLVVVAAWGADRRVDLSSGAAAFSFSFGGAAALGFAATFGAAFDAAGAAAGVNLAVRLYMIIN